MREVVEPVAELVEPAETVSEQSAASAEEVEVAPRRRGRPRKSVEGEDAASAEQVGVTRRRGRAKKSEEVKELFPFYEQSLF